MGDNSNPQALDSSQEFNLLLSIISLCLTFLSPERERKSSWACRTTMGTNSVTVGNMPFIFRLCPLDKVDHLDDMIWLCWYFRECPLWPQMALTPPLPSQIQVHHGVRGYCCYNLVIILCQQQIKDAIPCNICTIQGYYTKRTHYTG